MHETAAPHDIGDRSAPSAWADLEAELDRWSAAQHQATFWWRDDDAGSACTQLQRLFRVRAAAGIAVALATVPTRVDAAFRAQVSAEAGVAVLQHGYSHHNFAAPGERKIELDGSRPAEYVIAELAVGMQSLATLPAWVPVLVPPWNRIAPHLLPLLPELGFAGLSSLGARARKNAMVGLRQNNVHIDPIDWRGRHGPARAFSGTARAVAAAVAHLSARRTGTADRAEATGLMTHHLVQDEATWQFVEQLIARTSRHPAVKWLSANDVFEIGR